MIIMTNRPFPEAQKHGPLEALFDDVYFVTGGMRMARPPLSFSRNMTVLRNDDALTLVNSVRLNDSGLAELDKLGQVENVVRLAGFHGTDDPFYKDRYGATVWAIEDQLYVSGFEQAEERAYFQPDQFISDSSHLPVPGARLYRFGSAKPGEGLLLLERDGGILIAGDCLQNWQRTDQYFSLIARLMMPLKGFIKPHNIGPGWLQAVKPDPDELRGLLTLDFEHVLPAHGSPVIGGARDKYRDTIQRVATSL